MDLDAWLQHILMIFYNWWSRERLNSSMNEWRACERLNLPMNVWKIVLLLLDYTDLNWFCITLQPLWHNGRISMRITHAPNNNVCNTWRRSFICNSVLSFVVILWFTNFVQDNISGGIVSNEIRNLNAAFNKYDSYFYTAFKYIWMNDSVPFHWKLTLLYLFLNLKHCVSQQIYVRMLFEWILHVPSLTV